VNEKSPDALSRTGIFLGKRGKVLPLLGLWDHLRGLGGVANRIRIIGVFVNRFSCSLSLFIPLFSHGSIFHMISKVFAYLLLAYCLASSG